MWVSSISKSKETCLPATKVKGKRGWKFEISCRLWLSTGEVVIPQEIRFNYLNTWVKSSFLLDRICLWIYQGNLVQDKASKKTSSNIAPPIIIIRVRVVIPQVIRLNSSHTEIKSAPSPKQKFDGRNWKNYFFLVPHSTHHYPQLYTQDSNLTNHCNFIIDQKEVPNLS